MLSFYGQFDDHRLALDIFRMFCLDLHWLAHTNESRNEISNNVVCATSKCSDQPVHMRSLIRAYTSDLNFL